MSRLPGINREVTLYLVYSGLFYIGLFGITDVVLNFYFVSLGHEPDVIGVLQALPRFGGLLTGIPAGLLANRIGSRRMTIIATLATALTYPMLVFFPSLFMLGVSRFMLGLFFGATQVASAPLMMTLTENKYQTYQFSYHSVVTMVATAGGSLVAGYLPLMAAGALNVGEQSASAYGLALIVAGVIIALSAFPLIRLQGDTVIVRKPNAVKNQANHVPKMPGVSQPPGVSQLPGVSQPPVPWALLVWLSLPFMFFGFSGGLTFPFYNLLFRTVYDVPDATVGTILSLGWLGMGLITLSNPWWDKRFGRARGLGITMTIATVAFLALSIAPVLWMGIAAYVIATSVRNTMSPLFQPLLMDSLPSSLHNLASSVGFVLWNAGYFIASILGGIWQTEQGFGFIMQVVALAVFASGITVVYIFRKRQPYAHEPG